LTEFTITHQFNGKQTAEKLVIKLICDNGKKINLQCSESRGNIPDTTKSMKEV
jgi:ribosomal protein L33